MKNLYAKTVDIENAYAVYGCDGRLPGWEWRILKMYQAPEKAEKNKFARAFCAVKSPMTYGQFELGDTYLSDIGGFLISGVDLRGSHSIQNLKGGVHLEDLL